MFNTPLAYFLTFTTYGSRLPGDERGTVSRDHNGYGDPVLAENQARRSYSQELMRYPEVRLDLEMRRSVESAIRDYCGERGWLLSTLNVRTNHVHVVITAEAVAAATVAAQLKARATRRLREMGLTDNDSRVWARHGSSRLLFKVENVEEVVDYVLYQQGIPLT